MTSYDRMEFSKKLKILAGQHRYSQSMLARELDVSQNLVSLWTRGASIPDLYEAAKMAKLFNVDVNYLADDSLDDPPPAELEPDERELVSLYRALHLEKAEALRRLATDPGKPHVIYGPPPGYEHGTGRTVGARNETEDFARRIQERNAPKPAGPKRDEEPDGRRGRGAGKRNDGQGRSSR
jgi:transcriptional regulator with XRE-family HTH domain